MKLGTEALDRDPAKTESTSHAINAPKITPGPTSRTT